LWNFERKKTAFEAKASSSHLDSSGTTGGENGKIRQESYTKTEDHVWGLSLARVENLRTPKENLQEKGKGRTVVSNHRRFPGEPTEKLTRSHIRGIEGVRILIEHSCPGVGSRATNGTVTLFPTGISVA